MRGQKFYQITVNSEKRVADIIIYGDITKIATDMTRWYGDDENISEVASRQIIKEINDLDVDTINVYINSYGGEVAEALAIYSALKRHSASVHTFCDGFACSAATIIFCAGDVRTMGSIALMMIHNCMSYLGYANSNEMRKAAEDNDKINQSSINAYLAVSNLSEEEIRSMMDKATWMTAQECLEYGFATEVADMEEDEQEVQQSAFRMIRKAVLGDQWQVDFSPIMQKLTKLQEQIEALQKDTDDPDPEEDLDEDPDDPEEDPEEDPDDEDEKGNTKEKAKRFFNFMFSKEENEDA